MNQIEFVDLRYRPTGEDIIAEFYIHPAPGVSLKDAAATIASESSIGTWTDISTLKASVVKSLKPHVFYINQATGIAKIAYPLNLFEPGNIPQLLSSVAGNIFGMKVLRSLRLEDIKFPAPYISDFKGPKFGVEGIRKLLRIGKRPILGTIVKPKIGLGPRDFGKVAYNAWIGGIDAVKDDENLTSMRFNKFTDRVAATLSFRDKAEQVTGERKVYFPNITAPFDEMVRRAEFVKRQHGEYVMIDIITVGWSALQAFRNLDLGLAIHAHRAGHGIFTEDPEQGISMLVISKLARLIGVDQLHVGAIVGKMKGEAHEVEHIGEEISREFVINDEREHVLAQSWKGIKTVFPVCSGGLHAGVVGELMKHMGNDIIIQAGGGVCGHKSGVSAGARAMRQAVEAVMLGQTVRQYASTHLELRQALEQWVG